MPDLTPDGLPDPVYLPPALRPGGSINRPVISRPARDTRRDDPVPILARTRSLLDQLLSGLVDDPDETVEALMVLGRRDGRRPDRQPLDPLGDEPGVPVAASGLAVAVRGVIEEHATAPVSDEVVTQATMGVEFAAQVEASGGV